MARPLPPVPLRQELSVGRAEGLRRELEHRGLGALLRADGDRRGLPRRRPEVSLGATPGCLAPRREVHRRHQDAHAGHDDGAGRGVLSERRLSGGAGGPIRGHRRHLIAFFLKEGYQVAPVARSEAKRGTNDATYGYYTMGKLMILKLRDDYKAQQAKAGAP